jgi:hypothetical protein
VDLTEATLNPTHTFERTPRRGLAETFSQLLQETEYFCRWRQEKVAKIVPYAPPRIDEGLHAFVRSAQLNDSLDRSDMTCFVT